MIEEELTGRTGYRIQKRFLRPTLVVLQVEVRQYGYYMVNSGGRVESEDVDRTYYRDATVQDITRTTSEVSNKKI
jgi:hypothetical protein